MWNTFRKLFADDSPAEEPIVKKQKQKQKKERKLFRKKYTYIMTEKQMEEMQKADDDQPKPIVGEMIRETQP